MGGNHTDILFPKPSISVVGYEPIHGIPYEFRNNEKPGNQRPRKRKIFCNAKNSRGFRENPVIFHQKNGFEIGLRKIHFFQYALAHLRLQRTKVIHLFVISLCNEPNRPVA